MTRASLISIMLTICTLTSSKMAAQNPEMLPAATVSADMSPKALMAKATRLFRKMHPDAYYSDFEYTRKWSAQDQCCQFYYGRGIFYDTAFNRRAKKHYFNESPVSSYFVLSGFASAPLEPGSTAVMPELSRITNITSYQSYIHSFNNTPCSKLLNRKRTFEAWGPLNAAHTSDFDYSILSRTDTGYEIAFRTKTGAFPKKTRIHGRGIISLTPEFCVKAVIMDEFQDRYTDYIRDDTYGAYEPLTDELFRIEYEIVGNVLYEKSVSHDIAWTGASRKDLNRYWSAEVHSPCPSPIANVVKVRTSVTYSSQRLMSKHKRDAVYKTPCGTNDEMQIHTAAIPDNELEQILMEHLSQQEIHDLQRCGIPFDEQYEIYKKLYRARLETDEEYFLRLTAFYLHINDLLHSDEH